MASESNVTVIGAGTMGHGLAVQFGLTGHDVVLVDHRDQNLEDARAQIDQAVEFLVDESLIESEEADTVKDISFTLDRASGVVNADFVLETISESLDAKRELFTALVEEAPDDAVLASNTSGLRITDIAATVPNDADRVVGCHWWNPPYLMPLVEVVRGEETSDRTIERTQAIVESADRTPILVQRDVPGFVWNRIQFAVLRECLHIVEEGIASMEDVGRAVREGYALRTATVDPFETVDLSGVDLFRSIAAELNPDLCNDTEPSPLFDEYLDAGRTGVEDGAGFYEYDQSPEEVVTERDKRIAAIKRALSER